MHTIFSALLNFARAILVPRARLAAENAALRQQLRGPRKPVAGLSGPRDWAADAGESVPLTPTSTKIGSVGKAGWKLASTRTQFSNARTPAPQLQPRSCPYAASR